MSRMHTPDIKEIKNSLGVHFDEILIENWSTIYKEKKFHHSYYDGEKEVTLRFRLKDVTNEHIDLEIEKEIKHISGELPVEKSNVKVII